MTKEQKQSKPIKYPKPLIEQRADPFIYKHSDGYYYFTGSYPDFDRIILRRSETIAGLADADEKVIWWKHDGGKMGSHIWAPEIHYIDDKWYIHFAAGDAGKGPSTIRPYVLESSDSNPLEGDWIEKGQINLDFESFSLDATTFEHQGDRYLIWAQKDVKEINSFLYIAKMSNPWTICTRQVKIAAPQYNWERRGFNVNEGPAVIKRSGKIFVAYSASATDENYCMGLLTAAEDSDLLDPESWTKTPRPVFETNVENGEYGPGHNSFTVAEDGITDLLVYHARPYKGFLEGKDPLSDPNRHAQVQQLYWNDDGTPDFKVPGYKEKK
ncbi:putative beta-xylosidase [Halobacteroides halobius DSM 5150]|uniref:Putative beta-xylosidase n=1 Tax=Halobacteroides halobius (strain ATCC 35273 / DSM 5150 / MD-1) TaxID=748449 RepID=L0KAV4_HALHC|nr:glycoside hydrolase family 43 protein [Halobacteroides halobius]AGB41670.1 putative beta-xylosidase [Halobacteroides halobius DSM 5150]